MLITLNKLFRNEYTLKCCNGEHKYRGIISSPPGYSGDGAIKCTQNDCEPLCVEGATCKADQEGGLVCECDQGLTGDGTVACDGKINELLDF